MKELVPHACSRDRYCGLCHHNVKVGGVANHPSNLKRTDFPKVAPAGRRPLPTVCVSLGKQVRVAGSSRTWFLCVGGHGSTAKGAEGLVCGCGSKGVGVWRRGHECGPKCPGYVVQLHPVPEA